MAREKMVTRTIYRTKVKTLGMNLTTAQAEQRTFIIAGSYEGEKTTLKNLVHDIDYVPVKVIDHFTEELLYGMTEDEFIAHGRILPPRKVYDSAE